MFSGLSGSFCGVIKLFAITNLRIPRIIGIKTKPKAKFREKKSIKTDCGFGGAKAGSFEDNIVSYCFSSIFLTGYCRVEKTMNISFFSLLKIHLIAEKSNKEIKTTDVKSTF